jgi:cytochrome b6-f complex iron-sulfur subunit
MSQESRPVASRRQVITTGVVAVTGVGALAACGGSSGTTSGTTSTSSSAAAAPAASGSASGGALAKLSDVKVGTAVSAKGADGKPIIVAQPTAGTVVAFTAICTHQGCTVAPAAGLQLKCPCHGSTFDAATGKNTGGPAPSPLAAVPVKLDGDSIVAG